MIGHDVVPQCLHAIYCPLCISLGLTSIIVHPCCGGGVAHGCCQLLLSWCPHNRGSSSMDCTNGDVPADPQKQTVVRLDSQSMCMMANMHFDSKSMPVCCDTKRITHGYLVRLGGILFPHAASQRSPNLIRHCLLDQAWLVIGSKKRVMASGLPCKVHEQGAAYCSTDCTKHFRREQLFGKDTIIKLPITSSSDTIVPLFSLKKPTLIHHCSTLVSGSPTGSLIAGMGLLVLVEFL